MINDNKKINKKKDFYEEYKEQKDDIHKILFCLSHIIKKLKLGSISVMIGAGFSLNANEGKTKTEQNYKDWVGLLVDAYTELYKDEIKKFNYNESKIQTEIKTIGETNIADQYVQLKDSREALDLYIEDKFSKIDKETDYLGIHKNLLELNWCDIITTNWDDLLERANLDNSYKIVKSAKQLRYGNNKRIIKLNGSLRSIKKQTKNKYKFDDTFDYLYVITKKDFDNYKENHDGFSNFMKVKFLETPFCLLGFSGRDPNFRYWINELKRTMTKGGKTVKPNPIFLIDVGTEDSRSELDIKIDNQFYHNNYIIPIKIKNLYDSILRGEQIENLKIKLPNINKNFMRDDLLLIKKSQKVTNTPFESKDLVDFVINILKINTSNTKSDKSETLESENISNSNEQKSSLNNEKSHEIEPKDNKTTSQIVKLKQKNEDKSGESKKYIILESIAGFNSDTLSSQDIEKYNTLNLFYFDNLYFTEIIERKIQYGIDKDNMNINYFIFLYRWCLSNFCGLDTFYQSTYIEDLINFYFQKSYQKTEAYIFFELILKYYRENKSFNDFHSICSQYKNIERLNDIINFELALYYAEKLDYSSLTKILKNWNPKLQSKYGILFGIRKFSLENKLEIKNNHKVSAEKLKLLLEASKENNTEEQLDYFVRLIIKDYSLQNNYNIEIDLPNNNNLKKSFLYTNELIKSLNNIEENIQTNDSIRYSKTFRLVESENKNKIVSVIRLLNFVEYTGVPLRLAIKNNILIKDIIPIVTQLEYKKNYYLKKIIIENLNNSGMDASEEVIRNIIDKTLRYLNQKDIHEIFDKVLKIVNSKISINESIRVYLIVLTEITKFCNENKKKEFSNFLYSEITKESEHKNQVKEGIIAGKFWGLTLVFNYYIDILNDEQQFQFILEWLLEEFKTEYSRSKSSIFLETFSYIKKLINKASMIDIIKSVFKTEKIKKNLDYDLSREGNLNLYSYEYIPNTNQKKIREKFINNFSLQTDPYFIILLQTPEVKSKVFGFIKNFDFSIRTSLDNNLITFVKALNQQGYLDFDDKVELCTILSEKFNSSINNTEELSDYKQSVLLEFYYIVEEIATKEDLESSEIIRDTYNLLKKYYEKTNKRFVENSWLWTGNFQDFKIAFYEAIKYCSYLKCASKMSTTFQFALTKLILQDSPEFEAVISYVVQTFDNEYFQDLFNDKIIQTILLEILNKFELEIPYCYDYLFIKEKMKQLAVLLKEKGLESKSITYWLRQ